MQSRDTDIGAFVRKRENAYEAANPTKLSKYVDFDLKSHIEHIEAYKYSKHLSGSTDSQGREKPFFNIGTSASNVWYRATDLDRRNIRVKANKEKDVLAAFAATQKLQDYMKRDLFGVFLNKWGRVLADYGSAVCKFIEKDDGLHSMVVPWNRLIVDAISFENDVVIEILELTPDQLLQRDGYDKDMVMNLIDAREERETDTNEDADQKDEFIKLYEVHGMMPKSFRTGNPDDAYEYEQQMFVLSFVESKERGKYDDYVLAKGREDNHPYMVTHLIEEEGRVCGIGAYEYLFDAQWMTNHTAKSIKDQLDLASKLIFQTADDTFIGQNALHSIETGDIMVHADGKPLTQIANNSHDIGSLQAYGQQWERLAKELTSTPDAIRGDTMPSGTAYRSVAIQNRESHSLFELMTENKGLALEKMLREYHIPYFLKQLKNRDELAVTLDNAGISQIDPRFVKYEAQKRAKEEVKGILLDGSVDELGRVDSESVEQDIQQDLNSLGNQRFLKPSEISDKSWNDIFKDLEWDLEVEITNENTEKEVTMTTLTTVLQTIAANPTILSDPKASLLFNRILEETGKISPIELGSLASPQAPTPSQPLPEELSNLAPQQPT